MTTRHRLWTDGTILAADGVMLYRKGPGMEAKLRFIG
jgi:hypothetical protein